MKSSYAKIVSIIVSLVFIGAHSESFASGFGIFTQGASALGQGAAVIAHNETPEAIFYNPALINKLSGTQVEAGTTLIFIDREFKSEMTHEKTHTQDDIFFPSTFYATYQFNKLLSAGLGMFNPFGLATTWPKNWEGRYIATKSELNTYNINPVVSCRIIPELSVAVGLDIVYLDSTLESKVPSSMLGIPGPSFDIEQKFKGSGNGIGYNLGFLLDLTNSISVGISYRSEVEVDVSGDLTTSISPQKIVGRTEITLPQQVSAGISYKPNDNLIMEIGMRWEDWSSFDQLRIEIAGQSSSIYPRDWHETYAVNFGGKYLINDTSSISVGYLYGWNPIPKSTFESAIPDSNTHLFCLGTEVHFGELTVGLGYGYQLQDERKKFTNQYGSIANGEYNSRVHLLGISIVYKL